MNNRIMCKGCPKGNKHCTIFKVTKEHDIENKCPCISCLVKIQCGTWCSDIKEYCDYLYNNVEQDLVLSTISTGISVFTRKKYAESNKDAL